MKYHDIEHPQKCNLCGGKVVLTDNSIIYGKQYGYGKIYFCLKCGAFVGIHKKSDRAKGLLANEEMRILRKKCHSIFDSYWLSAKDKHIERNKLYKKLADRLNIKLDDCHFGHFDMAMLEKAYRTLKNEF